MHYMVTVQLDGRLVCSDCFCTSRAVVIGRVSVFEVNTDGQVTEAHEGRVEVGKDSSWK
jgi:hypothetical protein